MAAKTIKDSASITDHVADWVYNNCPSLSVDSLLCRPIDAMQMALDVAALSGKLTAAQAKQIAKHVAALQAMEVEMDVLDEICCTALNSRKRGEFRK